MTSKRPMPPKLCVVHDRRDDGLPAALRALSRRWTVIPIDIHGADPSEGAFDCPWLVDVETMTADTARRLRELTAVAAGHPRVFAVPPDDRASIVQAFALGATAVVRRPIDVEDVGEALRSGGSATAPGRRAAKPVGIPAPGVRKRRSVGEGHRRPSGAAGRPRVDRALAEAEMLFDQVFTGGVNGAEIPLSGWRSVVVDVMSVSTEYGLSVWLDQVREHHVGTYQHSLLTMAIAAVFAEVAGLPTPEAEQFVLGGLLHDVGKCRVPEEILSKPGKLTEEEYAQVRRHARASWEVLSRVRPPLSRTVLEIVLHHHESLDGTGYPDGLAGEAIPRPTRMMTVCDVYAALIECRSYRPPLPSAQALAILRAMAQSGRVEAEDVERLSVAVARIEERETFD